MARLLHHRYPGLFHLLALDNVLDLRHKDIQSDKKNGRYGDKSQMWLELIRTLQNKNTSGARHDPQLTRRYISTYLNISTRTP